MKKRPVIGDIVELKFWDHAENSRDALLFVVIGRVSNITKRADIVHTWQYVNATDKSADDNDANAVWIAIVNSAISDIRRLK